jgi:hypothetical protein
MSKKKERQPIVLSLVPTGSPDLPRYRIADPSLNYWTGERWSEFEEDGIVFENANDGAKEIQKLLMLQYMNRPLRRFKAPVYLDLYTDHNVSKEEVVNWLGHVARLIMDAQTFGNGPIEGALGLIRIEWGETEEMKS